MTNDETNPNDEFLNLIPCPLGSDGRPVGEPKQFGFSFIGISFVIRHWSFVIFPGLLT